MHCLTAPANKRTVRKGGFFIGNLERLGSNSRGSEFDKEEQARRKYRRTCDDEAAERRCSQSSAPATQDEAAEKRLFSLYIRRLIESV